MKRNRAILIAFVVGLLCGTAGTVVCLRLAKAPTLTAEFGRSGVTLDKIVKLEIEGDENSFSSGKRISITDKETIKWIWQHCVETASPYEYWVSSGARRLHFYTQDSPNRPVATLFVNETDCSNLENSKHSYMCHGLHGVLLDYLTKQAAGKKADGSSQEQRIVAQR